MDVGTAMDMGLSPVFTDCMRVCVCACLRVCFRGWQEIRHREPDYGFRRVLGVLKQAHPDWQVSEKRVRKCFERCDGRERDAAHVMRLCHPRELRRTLDNS